MAQNQYKKNYEGDYKKSYKDYAAWAKEAAQKKQEYQTISKKLDDSPYNKKERSDYYDITGRKPKESERVYAEGGRRQQPTPQVENQNKREAEHKRDMPTSPQTAPTAQTQPRVEEKQVPYTPPIIEIEDDGNYNFFNPPIKQIGVNKYKNLKTNKEIGLEEARHVLKLAGYTPKGSFGIGTLIFIYVILNIVISFVAPFVAIGYGAFKIFTQYSTWVKQGASKFYTVNLPASQEELENNKRIGQICIIVGGLSFLFRYRDFLF